MTYTKIDPPPIKSDKKDLYNTIESIRRALKEIYKELDRLEKNKQDA